MPVQVKDPTDIQSAYDELGNPSKTEANLNAAESQASDASYVNSGIDQLEAYANDPRNSNVSSEIGAKEASHSSNAGWVDNTSKGALPNPIGRGQKALRMAKQSGPFGLIAGVLIGGASVVSFFGGPGLLIVNFAEVLTEKFNYQLGVMDARNTRIIEAKLNNTTKGLCTSVTSKLCKFSTFSDKEIANFEKAGLKVNKTGTAISGRTKISSFEMIDGTAVDAANFRSAMKNMPEFKNSMKRAYNMKYLGTSDSIFMGLLESYKARKVSPFPDEAESDADRAAALDDAVKNGTDPTISGSVCKNADSCSDADKATDKTRADTAADIVDDAAENSDSTANRVLNETADVIDGTSTDVGDLYNKVGNVAGNAWQVGSSAVKATGSLDNACMVYGWVKAFSVAAKVVRSAQLIRLAMPFLTASSMIKAGTAKAKDISYLATMLTKIVTVNGKKTKAATDSLGYRYAAYGDTGMTASATNAVAGATFPATIQSGIDMVTGVLGSRSGADGTCGFLANPFVQAGSLALGIASFFVGAGEVKLSLQAVTAPILIVIAGFLPPMLGEILSGKVITPSTIGEVAGDLITSGTSSLLSKSSSRGGSAILKRAQATSYMQYQESVLADYADYDRSTLSALDASNPNTFLGSIYTQLTPYLRQSATVTGALSSIGSILTSSVSNITSPKASAAIYGFADCKDMVVEDLDLATDPYCNPVTGIPTEYLNEDPITVFNNLLSRGLIDAEGNPQGAYPGFIANCIDRENPYGVSGADEVDHTADCFIDSRDKAEMYLYQADSRIIDVRENDTSSATSGDTATPSGTCPIGSTVVPSITEGWNDGVKESITLCGIASLIRTPVIADGEFNKDIYGGLASKDIKTHAVNSTAAESLLKLISRAKDNSVTIFATFSYRSYNEQKAIRAIKTLDANGNLTNNRLPGNYNASRAEAGKSNHQMGLALDLTDASRNWIKKCISNNLDDTNDGRCYGFYDDVGGDPNHFTFKPA